MKVPKVNVDRFIKPELRKKIKAFFHVTLKSVPGKIGQSLKRTHSVAVADWKRLRTNVVAIVVLMGLVVLPALYGWFNIMSNWSPYSEDKTSRIQVAVVSEDKGVEALDLLSVNVGDTVIDSLRKNDVIGWCFVDTKDEAVNGVVAGDYYAAIVMPEDFSEQILSVLTGFIEHPHVEYYENMKRNAIAPKITGKAQTSVTQQINETFQGKITEVISMVGELLSHYDAGAVITNFMADVETIQNDVTAYIGLMGSLNKMVQSSDMTLSALENTIPYMSQSLGEMKSSVNTIDEVINSNFGGGGILPPTPTPTPGATPAPATTPSSTSEPAPTLDPSITPAPMPSAADNVHRAVASVNSALDNSAASLNAYQSNISSARGTLQTASARLNEAATSLSQLQTDLGNMRDQMEKMDLAKIEKVMDIINQDGEALVEFIKAPVRVENIRVYPVENYGSTTAPFYSVLALWIGSLILVVIIHTKVLPEPGLEDLRPYERFFGRFMIFFVLGQIQALLIVLGDLLFIGIQCLHPFLFWMACALASATFSIMMYAMVYALDNVGEAAGLVLLVIQVAGSGGSYPIEVLPVVYQKLYKFMPFTYAMNAIRETIAGRYREDYWSFMSYMFIFILVSFGIALLRKPCEKLMDYIEEKKADAYLMK